MRSVLHAVAAHAQHSHFAFRWGETSCALRVATRQLPQLQVASCELPVARSQCAISSWLRILFAHLFAYFLTRLRLRLWLRLRLLLSFTMAPTPRPLRSSIRNLFVVFFLFIFVFYFCLSAMQFNCLLLNFLAFFGCDERGWGALFIVFWLLICFSCLPPPLNSSFSLHFYEVFVWVV